MHTSSYLEAFLSVYGWMMYNTLYELFAMTWLLFLPFMKLGFFTFIDTLSDSANRYGQFKKGIITFVLMIFALFLAVVPLDPIKVEGTTIIPHCKAEEVANRKPLIIGKEPQKEKSFYGFDVTEKGKVPLLPSLVMRIASGTNNVIYQSMPCVPSVRNFAMVVKTSEVTNPALQKEMKIFDEQCAVPTRDRMNRIAAETPKTYQKILDWSKEQDKNKIYSSKKEKNEYTDLREKNYPGSKMYQIFMSGNLSEIGSIVEPTEKDRFNEIMLGSNPQENAFRSSDSVEGVVSDDQDASQKQHNSNTGTVKCSDWWEQKLYPNLKSNASNDVALRLARDEAFKDSCHKQVWLSNMNVKKAYDAESCQKVVNKASGDENFIDEVVFRMITNLNDSGMAMHQEDRDTVETIGTLGIIGAVFSAFVGLGDSVFSDITNNTASFYAQMFFYRVVLQMLQPMLLMGIFTFWGIYLIIADYRWETILKGLILIFIISLMPGLWAISQHLDNALWQALYPDVNTLAELANRSNKNYVERILLDAASTMFNVIFPLILMYLVNEAGGGRPGAAFQSTQGSAENIGGTSGRMAGSSAGGAVNTAERGAQKGIDKFRQWRAGRRDQANLPPGGSRY